MALTHVYNAPQRALKQADLADLKTQLDTAIALIDTMIADATVTNAEAVTYLKQLAVIQKRMLKALARLMVV